MGLLCHMTFPCWYCRGAQFVRSPLLHGLKARLHLGLSIFIAAGENIQKPGKAIIVMVGVVAATIL